MKIKNINIRFGNIASKLKKKIVIKIITNNMYYTSAFVAMCFISLPPYQNNNIDSNEDISNSNTTTSNFTITIEENVLNNNIPTNNIETTMKVNVPNNIKTTMKVNVEKPIKATEVVYEEVEDENNLCNMPELEINDESVYYREAKAYDYTDEEFEQICKIAYLEAGGTTEEERYIDSMAVVSVILNRIEDERWCTLGATPLEQIYAENQFTTLNASFNLEYDEVPNYTRNAVSDCLNGIRNNIFVSFRAKENSGKNRVQIVDQGNNYFEKMNEKENVLIKK